MAPKIQTHFKVTGCFNPKEFTNKTGLTPTNTWKKGEVVQNTLVTRESDGWKLSTDEIITHDLDAEIKNLISLLSPSKIPIVDYCARNNLNAVFSCVIYTEDDEFPSIHFDRELLEDIRAINAEIDIDVY